jgi:hypothetical protein
MPTPKAGYFLKDGTKVPGTTTITGAYKDSGGLIHWAWQQGLAKLDYRETRDRAGDIGTLVHEAIEARLNGLPIPSPENGAQAIGAFLKWEEQNNIEIVQQEIQLVSEEYRYGGTLDAVGIVDGTYVLLDWKTSKGVYKNYLLQLAAYVQLWNENFPSREIEGGAYLVRFDKKDGICEPYHFSLEDLMTPLAQFLALREAYGREYLLDMILEKAKSCMKPL